MKYSSPFHLLQGRDASALTDDKLKRWKKELMLQFDLNKSTTIKIKKKEYDKNDALQVFDNLKDRPEYHWRLYQNKPLLNFLEYKHIDFFDDEENWADLEDISYRNWLAQWFIPAYDRMICRITEVKNRNSLKMLQRLGDSDFQLPEEWQDQALVKTHRLFKTFVQQAEFLFENRLFIGKGKVKFKPEIHQYLDVHYANVLNILPNNFDYLRRRYSDFSYNIIIVAFNGRRAFKEFEKQSLNSVAEAARISLAIDNDKYSKSLLQDIEAYQKQSWSKDLGAGLIFLLLLIFLIRLLNFISHM